MGRKSGSILDIKEESIILYEEHSLQPSPDVYSVVVTHCGIKYAGNNFKIQSV